LPKRKSFRLVISANGDTEGEFFSGFVGRYDNDEAKHQNPESLEKICGR
jgi:hypothetical protein